MKKFVIGILTFALSVFTLFSMTACDKIVKLTFSLTVYNEDTSAREQKTLTFDMYENLAETAVAAVRDAVNNGSYDDCVFYKQNTYKTENLSSQLMFGSLKKSGGSYEKVTQAAVPGAEFEKNGVTGSNLTNSVGYLGLWRSWSSNNDDGYKTSGYDKSTASLYMPTDDLSSYNGYFCVFAKYSTQEDLDLINDIVALFDSSENYTEYTCYYTANADGTLYLDGEGNPVWNIVLSSAFDDVTNAYDSGDDPTAGTNPDTQYDSYTATVLNAEKLAITDITVG